MDDRGEFRCPSDGWPRLSGLPKVVLSLWQFGKYVDYEAHFHHFARAERINFWELCRWDVQGRKNSGISPVVATVILVAVAIVIAIAVAFWASKLVGVFTRYEQLEVLSAYQSAPNSITIIVTNRGSTNSSIIQVVVNGIRVYPNGGTTFTPPSINIGARITCTLTFAGPLQAGVTYMVELKTSGGKTYPTAVLATMGGGEAGVPNIAGFTCGGA